MVCLDEIQRNAPLLAHINNGGPKKNKTQSEQTNTSIKPDSKGL